MSNDWWGRMERVFDRVASIYMTKGPSILLCAVIAAGLLFVVSDPIKSWCANVV